MTIRQCCDTMTEQLSWWCDHHAAVWDCPDALVWYDPRFAEYGMIIHDGGASYIVLGFCPWCGRRLPPSYREQWFEELERRGIDPHEDDLPSAFEDDTWRAGLDPTVPLIAGHRVLAI
jgi:hypothetical protein